MNETDALVAEARELQAQLNATLDKLDPLGVTCDSVIGSMDARRPDLGMMWAISRVQLNLTFAAVRPA